MYSGSSYDNPLGFSNQTAALVFGLGCTNLKQFQKRDINSEDLQYLTKEDLKILEVGDDFDYESFEKLQISLRRKRDAKIKPKASDILNIMEVNKKQLVLVDLYLKLVPKLMVRDNIDYIIDKNKNMKGSHGVKLGAESILAEIDIMLEALDKLKPDQEPKSSKNKFKYILIGGLGIGTGICIIMVYRIYFK